jgi:hypothetical protein
VLEQLVRIEVGVRITPAIWPIFTSLLSVRSTASTAVSIIFLQNGVVDADRTDLA